MSRPLRPGAVPLGLAAAAAALCLLAAVQPPVRPGPSDELAPTRLTPATRFAAALTALGTRPGDTWVDEGVVHALFRDARPERRPLLQVNAALAATAISQTCRCRLRGYAIVTDRFGPDLLAIGGGPIEDVDDRRGPVDDIKWKMDPASDERIEQVARRQAVAAASSTARRVTRLITRDGEVVWAFARRPATAKTWSYTAPGIEVPVPSGGAAGE